MPLAILLAVVLAIPASRLIYGLFNKDSNEESGGGSQAATEVEVPDLDSLTEDEARSTLRGLGLSMEVEMELASDTYEAGTVMSQTPSEGSKVKPGYTIRVNLSKGSVDGKVPPVEGKSLAGARQIIQSYGYVVGSVTEQISDDVPVGAVISQNPARGTSLPAGGTVDLVVSSGPETIVAGKLNVVGMTLAQAETEMRAIGVGLGEVTRQTDENVPKDHIISQNPGPDTELNQGDLIDVVVSDYEPPSQTGDTVPGESEEQTGSEESENEMYSITIPIDFSTAENEDFLLTINVADGVYDARTPISQLPCKKSDQYMSVSVSGAGTDGKVYVFFDNTLAYEYRVNFEEATYY